MVEPDMTLEIPEKAIRKALVDGQIILEAQDKSRVAPTVYEIKII